MAKDENRRVSLVVEIVLLVIVMVVHYHLPNVAGTLGISFAAALQTTSFAKVEGWPFSSVMTTGNLRQSVEAALVHVAGEQRDSQALRQTFVFAMIVLAFGIGAALGATMTRFIEAKRTNYSDYVVIIRSNNNESSTTK